MKNRLSDLNNYLFAQLERLDDESLSTERMNTEIERSKAIAMVSAQIIHSGSLALKAKEYMYDARVEALPHLLE